MSHRQPPSPAPAPAPLGHCRWVIRAPTDVPALRKGWQSAGFEDDDAHRSWVQFVNLVPAYDGTPMLLAINNGRYARHLDGLSQEGVMQEGMKALRDMFADNTIPEPVAFKASNWTHDKHALGAYPYWAVSGWQRKRGGRSARSLWVVASAGSHRGSSAHLGSASALSAERRAPGPGRHHSGGPAHLLCGRLG